MAAIEMAVAELMAFMPPGRNDRPLADSNLALGDDARRYASPGLS